MAMKIAVWYHTILSGPRIHNEPHALALTQNQMNALKLSGLLDAADEFFVGINGGDGDALLVSAMSPCPLVNLLVNGTEAASELATLNHLQKWLKPGWSVFYHHIKGVQYPGNPIWNRWRKCMENACVWGWRECHMLLESGRCDTCGAHWMTSAKYPMLPKNHRYWGGNFWWATSDYLLTLPPVKPDSFEARYDAETWIGSGRKTPKVHDFSPHWPMNCPV